LIQPISYLGADSAPDHDQQSSPPPAHSPENEPPEFLSHPRDLSDDEEADYSKSQSQSYLQKKGAYDSRIQQLLYENPELEIIIADAGKSSDGSYIVYRIRTGVHLAMSRHTVLADQA
jgi:sorting nexin-41/42